MKLRLATLLMLALPLGATASVGCVSSKKPSSEQKAVNPSKFVVEAPPADLVKLDINMGDKITLLGYTMNATGTVKPGQKIIYKLYWQVNTALGEKGWGLFTHVLNSKHEKLVNIDNVGPLRDNGKSKGQFFPPSKWEAGKIYVDEQTFKVPNTVQGDLIKITTGIWKGKTRLEPKTGPHIDKNRALVATLNVAGKSSTDTQVPALRLDKLDAKSKIKIDGKFDEAVWASAPSTGDFVNVSSGKPDASSKVQGKAKMLWDNESLYLAFEVTDEDIVGGFQKIDKDPHLWTKDCVEIMIDPDGDGDNKDYYEIQVNPQNLVFDSQFDSYNKPKGGENGPFGNQDWSAKLKSAVQIDGTLDKSDDKDKGYAVEVQVPWASFTKAKKQPPELGSEWRFNLYAMQNNGGVAWSPIRSQGNFHKASRFGRVLFATKDWVDPKAAPAAPKTDPASANSAHSAADEKASTTHPKLTERAQPGAVKKPTPEALRAAPPKPATSAKP